MPNLNSEITNSTIYPKLSYSEYTELFILGVKINTTHILNQEQSIESMANFPGNDTLLLMERIQNPTIRGQIINTLYEGQPDTFPIPKEEYPWDIRDCPKPLFKKTKEQIKQELDDRCLIVFASTSSISDDEPNGIGGMGWLGEPGIIYYRSIHPVMNRLYSKKELSITEAHEKGHGIRIMPYINKALKTKIYSGFDFENAEIPQFLFALGKQEGLNTEEELRKGLIEYHTVDEIIERMSQLKNYFGMRGSELFTQEHLEYVKKHYADDTGMGFNIDFFLNAISEKNKTQFIHLINTIGV